LIETKQDKAARDFTQVTLQQLHPYDVYAHCAVGLLLYGQAREIRPTSSEQLKDKVSKSLRSVEFFDKALKYDPYCAFAAMGIAIALVEGTLMPQSLSSQEANTARVKNARDALSILTKIRDTMSNSQDPHAGASVYINLGHVFASREEWERAIENVGC